MHSIMHSVMHYLRDGGRKRPSVTLEEGKDEGLCGTPGCELADYHEVE